MLYARKFMKAIDTKCVNAFMNLSVHPSGTVKPCCMSSYEYKTDKEDTHLNQASILEFWSSESRKSFIDILESGVQHPACKFCWQEEESGKESKRIRDNKIYNNRELNENSLPLVVDLSMGNLCNLKCRICSPTHSTPWMIEEADLRNPDNRKEFTGQLRWLISKSSFDYSNNLFWDDIVKLLPNAEKLDFAGGEPFYIDKHWDIVKKIVDNGWSKNQHIHYNTNGTIFPEKHIELLEQFKIVDIQISSDGIGKKFEYLRHPANFSEVEENIDKFCRIRDFSKTTWFVGVCISISAFNVFDFFEMFEHYADKGIRMYINIVHDHHGIRVLPIEVKEKIIDRLLSKYSKQQGLWEKERDMVINHLRNTTFSQYDWDEFCKEIDVRDRYRKESFKDTFPEYYELIKGYINVERTN
jgi:MoaA/NifB/PqqE/SkfB family radical SAM enzyme